MQKKSLLVALFCGALCLTGCLKNEESASVVQVRNAKAKELNSIATLNEAKAAAEAVYAEAALTVAKAEKALADAQSNLINAQAETEKVRAELMKVNVQLAEVVLDEEKVKLEILKANLESRLAALEVEKAAAEAAKQAWINTLNQLLADAEVQAIENAQAILEAEEKIEAYVLTLEAQKADSVKKYSRKYFKALDKVQALQKEQLEIKAQKALIEAGAEVAKDAIHFEIDQLNEQIDENNAIIAALKAHQTMDPKVAEAELNEARHALSDAYAAYQDAITATSTAYTNFSTVKNKKADFNNESYGWPTYGSKWYYDFKKNIQDLFGWADDGGIYDEDHTVEVVFGEDVEKVKAGGIVVRKKENNFKPEFIPFWHNEATFKVQSRYPEVYVSSYEAGKPVDYVLLETRNIAPATIYYDNVKAALDTVVSINERKAARQIARLEKAFDEDTAKVNKSIARKEAKLALHQDYVKVRKAKVEAAENAYVAELKKHETYVSEKAKAWKAFQDHMVVNYDETRETFIARYAADTTEQGAARDTLSALSALNAAVQAAPDTDIQKAFEDFVKVEGEYNKIAAYKTSDLATKYAGEMTEAAKRWDPKFAAAVLAGGDVEYTANPNEDGYLTYPAGWRIKNIPTIKAGSAQDSLLTWNYNLALAEEKEYIAKENVVRYPTGHPQHSTYQTAYTNAQTLTEEIDGEINDPDGIQDKYDDAETAYSSAESGYNTAIHKTELDAIVVKYNPKFNDNKITTICSFPTDGAPEAKCTIKRNGFSGVQYDWDNEEWYVWAGWNQKEVAGTAQAEFLDAVFGVYLSDLQIAFAENNLRQAMMKYGWAAWNLFWADFNLMTALGADMSEVAFWDIPQFVEDNIKDYIDETADGLYDAYLAVEDDSDVDTAEKALKKAYSFNPDEIGRLQVDEDGVRYEPDDDVYKKFEEAQFGWYRSSYQVDYEATVVNLSERPGYKLGERIPVALVLGEVKMKNIAEEGEDPELVPVLSRDGKEILDYKNSLSFQIEKAEKYRDVIAPKELAKDIKEVEDGLATTKDNIAGFLADVNEYKTYEDDYTKWIAARQDAEKTYNQAVKDEFDAKQKYIAAKADLVAAEAAADQIVYVYVGAVEGDKITINGKEYEVDGEGFIELTIAEEIARLEGGRGTLITGANALINIASDLIRDVTHVENESGDVAKIKKALDELKADNNRYLNGESNFELKVTKKILEKALEYGKIALQALVEIYDDEIEEMDEKIDVWNAIAAKYKAIMNAYLGIVDETGPLVTEEEGEEE